MNKTNFMTKEQALRIALQTAGIENCEYCCLSNNYECGCFRVIVWTPYLKYEIYVDTETGEAAGIDTVPVLYREALCFCSGDENSLTDAA